MLSKMEKEIWKEGYDIHEKFRDQLTTPEKWLEFSDAVAAMMNRHNLDPVALRMGDMLMAIMDDAYRNGGRPTPVQEAFFDEEAFA